MVTAKTLNSCKRLIQRNKFNGSIITVTTYSRSKKTSRLPFIVKSISVLILCKIPLMIGRMTISILYPCSWFEELGLFSGNCPKAPKTHNK